jgi:tripartite-type tricarboxylate transporter receptor subunit TctC
MNSRIRRVALAVGTLALLSGDVSVGRPILTAPNVPADRVAALRQAFAETMRDPQFIAAAKQANLNMNPMSGEELQQVVDAIASAPADVVSRVKAAIAIKDVQRKQ